jgi:hypothetical protein
MTETRTLHMLHTLDAVVDENATTVRRGTKWAGTMLGTHLELCVCTRDPESHDVQGTGLVLGTWEGKFEDLPVWALAHEHEERSREYSGLRDSMRKAYGPDFSEQDFVVVLLYRRTA